MRISPSLVTYPQWEFRPKSLATLNGNSALTLYKTHLAFKFLLIPRNCQPPMSSDGKLRMPTSAHLKTAANGGERREPNPSESKIDIEAPMCVRNGVGDRQRNYKSITIRTL